MTKTVSQDRVREEVRAEATDLGENKVQEGLKKAAALHTEEVRWSMIGHLQSNKAKDVLNFASEVQSLDRLSLATALEKRLQALGHGLDVLVQDNTSGEVSKFGLAPEEVAGFLEELPAFSALRPKGFMTLATFTKDEGEVAAPFDCCERFATKPFRMPRMVQRSPKLSMGMSSDYEVAIDEGATIGRVGQAVFGARPLPVSYYWPGAAGR